MPVMTKIMPVMTKIMPVMSKASRALKSATDIACLLLVMTMFVATANDAAGGQGVCLDEQTKPSCHM